MSRSAYWLAKYDEAIEAGCTDAEAVRYANGGEVERMLDRADQEKDDRE